MEYQYVEAIPKSLIWFLQMTTYYFVRQIVKNAKLLLMFSSYMKLLRVKKSMRINPVFFSNNTPDDRRCEVLNMLGPMQDTRHKKYLGLPSIIGKSKVEIFVEIKERVEKKLSWWKEKMLSVGGREILIKAVAQAIPTYTMSCFQIPKSLCDEKVLVGSKGSRIKNCLGWLKENVQVQVEWRNGFQKFTSFQPCYAS